jgi:arylsulfatase A-like enzyme
MPHLPQYASPAFAGKSKDGLYGDCIEELDASTGRILDELRALGLAEKTLVIFTSDNGAAHDLSEWKKLAEGSRP